MVTEDIKEKLLALIRSKKISWDTMRKKDWKVDYRNGWNAALESLEKELINL